MADIIEWENKLLPSLKNTIDVLSNIIKEDDIICDIGANTGLLIEKLFETSPKFKCILIEPIKEYYDVIENKFKDDSRVLDYFNVALYKETTKLTFSKDSLNLGWNTIQDISKYGNSENVKAVTFSDLFVDNNLPHIDIFKIDVEQSERFVIEGMREYFETQKLPRIIHMEIGIHVGDKEWEYEKEMIEYIFSLGYKRFDYEQNNTYDAIFERI